MLATFRSGSRFWPRCDAAQSELGGSRQRVLGGSLHQFLDPATSTESLWTLIWCWRPLFWRSCSPSAAGPNSDGNPGWSGVTHHRKDAGRDYLGYPSGKAQKVKHGKFSFKKLQIIVHLSKPPKAHLQLCLQGGKLFAATEAFLPFEIELSRERLRPIGFTTIGGMLEQKVAITVVSGI